MTFEVGQQVKVTFPLDFCFDESHFGRTFHDFTGKSVPATVTQATGNILTLTFPDGRWYWHSQKVEERDGIIVEPAGAQEDK